VTVVRHEHVLRRDVAVHDAERGSVVIGELVGVVESGQGIGDDAQLGADGEHVPVPQPGADATERLSVQVLHDDEVLAIVLAHFVRLHDVRVIEARGEARLVEEHTEQIRFFGEPAPRLLHDDELVETCQSLGDRQIHPRHAAPTDLRDEAVLPEPLRPVSVVGRHSAGTTLRAVSGACVEIALHGRCGSVTE
jgi:hypothetical protein